MGEHTTWFDLLPGMQNLGHFFETYFRREAGLQAFPTAFSITHVVSAAFVVLFCIVGAMSFSRAVSAGGEGAIVPPRKWNLRNLFEMFTDAVLSVGEGVMGEKNARKYLPLIGTLACFIFFSNVLALIPGFVPPTATLKTNVALAVTVFVLTHYYGVKENGIAYFKHFLGPVIWLAPLMLPIELVSHIARPLSLSLRLLGNIAADHKVVSAFFVLVPLVVPVPFLILGVLVCIIQTMVFCLLSMVYIQGAVAHEHGDEGHGHEHAEGHH
jgi:F-type H+-transporting ATPase subunit a